MIPSLPNDDVLLGILNLFALMGQSVSWRRRLSKQVLAIWEDIAILKAHLEYSVKMAAITEVPCHNAYTIYRKTNW